MNKFRLFGNLFALLVFCGTIYANTWKTIVIPSFQIRDTLLIPDTNLIFKHIPGILTYISTKYSMLDKKYPPTRDGLYRTAKHMEFSHCQAIMIAKFLENNPVERKKENLFYLLGIAHDQKIDANRVISLVKLFPEECQKSETAKKIFARLERNKTSTNSVAAFLNDKYSDVDGKQLSLSINKNKQKLVIFWASWCSPCRVESKELLNQYPLLDTGRLEIIGLSLDEKITAWKSTLKADKYPWRNLVDINGFKSKLAIYLNINSIPSSILTDPEGNIKTVNPSVEYILSNFRK